jgi:hypothetical protein
LAADQPSENPALSASLTSEESAILIEDRQDLFLEKSSSGAFADARVPEPLL